MVVVSLFVFNEGRGVCVLGGGVLYDFFFFFNNYFFQ